MAIKKDTLDQLLDGRDPKEVFNKDGLFDELKKALAERVLNAELDDHLESEAPAGRRNHRNGHSKKTILTETAKLDIRIPRDREGTFDPKLIAGYQRRFPGFDEKIVSMYARGMTPREIQGHLTVTTPRPQGRFGPRRLGPSRGIREERARPSAAAPSTAAKK